MAFSPIAGKVGGMAEKAGSEPGDGKAILILFPSSPTKEHGRRSWAEK